MNLLDGSTKIRIRQYRYCLFAGHTDFQSQTVTLLVIEVDDNF